jgi:hypothetical protein
MKRLIFVIAVLFVGSCATNLAAVYAQATKDEITSQEKKAANEIADRFIARLDDTGNIEPLTKELFVSDFMLRFVKEKKRELLAKQELKDRMFFTSGIEYDASLLDMATDDDWKRLYCGTFNHLYYGYAVTQNALAKSLLSGKELDDTLDKVLENIYPPGVLKLFDANPILRNFIKKKDNSRPIRTVEELRSVNDALEQGVKLLRTDKRARQMKMTPDSKRVLEVMKNKMHDELGPTLEIADSDEYGFSKGTRILLIRASAAFQLMIVRVGGEYKIFSANLYAGD